MADKRVIGSKIREEMQRSVQLRNISMNLNLPFEKGMELKRQQDEAFRKAQFFKKLSKAINEAEND